MAGEGSRSRPPLRVAGVVRRRWSAPAVAGGLAVYLLWLPVAHAAFVVTNDNGPNTITAAATFPDYPTQVAGDSPLFYHRLDDAAGSVTATDSSGNGNTGIYGSSTNSQGWTGLWPMDDNSGTTAEDLSGAATVHDLTLHGAGWSSTARSRSALSFNGTSDYADTTASVVPTNANFTVAAWVYLTDTTTSRTAVSENGANVSAFELGYDQPTNKWVFAMARSDSAVATVDKAVSSSAPSTNTWTHLMAAFNSGTSVMTLYVNGVSQPTTTFAGTQWNATGNVEVGAGLSTARTHFWQGNVDDVRVQPLSRGTAAAQELTIGTSGGAATWWKLDDNSGTTTVDSAGHLNRGTFGSSASWGAAKLGAASVDLPGDANGYVAGATAGVDTSAGFSVAAWVYLDHTTLAAMSRTAVSQSGDVMSGFLLGYSHYNQNWYFRATRGPAANYTPVFDGSFSANNSATLNTWVHLLGVHDADAQTVTLYVNGQAQTGAAHTAVYDATGPLQVGRVKEFGAWQTGDAGSEMWGPWAGRVDDVQVFRRALTQPEITAVYRGGYAYNTLGVPGALQGAQQGQGDSTALAFAASGSRTSFNPTPYVNPTTFSLECWFRTDSAPNGARGVGLITFGDKSNGNSVIPSRELSLDSTGHLRLAAFDDATSAVSTTTYLDGDWHHAVGTVSPATGQNLYVDGALVATAAYAVPYSFTGYWRFGGDTWNVSLLYDYFHLGELDEVAVYPSVLSAQQVAWHYHANH